MPEYKWKKVTIPENVETIDCNSSTYDRLKDFRMDPKGFFLIKIDKEKGLIEAGFVETKSFVMEKKFVGKTAIEMFNTIIKHGYITKLEHAADVGAELQKAEIALKHNLVYVQDEELKLK